MTNQKSPLYLLDNQGQYAICMSHDLSVQIRCLHFISVPIRQEESEAQVRLLEVKGALASLTGGDNDNAR